MSTRTLWRVVANTNMKQYDRESKKWLSEEEIAKKVKKRDTCKGGRPHDYVEVLPYGVSALEGYAGSVEPYYEAEKAIAEFSQKEYDMLREKYGIDAKYMRVSRLFNYRRFMCSVCHKQTTK